MSYHLKWLSARPIITKVAEANYNPQYTRDCEGWTFEFTECTYDKISKSYCVQVFHDSRIGCLIEICSINEDDLPIRATGKNCLKWFLNIIDTEILVAMLHVVHENGIQAGHEKVKHDLRKFLDKK